MTKKEKVKKPFYKKWWVWVLAVIIIGSIATGGEEDSDQDASPENEKSSEVVASTNDSSEKAEKEEAEKKAAEEKAQEEKAAEEAKENSVPREYKSALNKAEDYVITMNLSKAGVYDQLTSEYGEGFPAEAAQYAIDNLDDIDWKDIALKKAESYAESMDMSNSAIYDQLISDYGEKFTSEEAQYAIDNLE